jgi:hypothetical protein
MHKIKKYFKSIYIKIINYILLSGRFIHFSNLSKTQNDDFFQLFKKGIIG